ncbi:MAG: dienelactone hydrolase family protein [Planctomycetes bacterium]|nr:dienelactone hydrolase family protein [Planctomycetota bacterium]
MARPSAILCACLCFGTILAAQAADAGWQRLSLAGGSAYAWRYVPASVDQSQPAPVAMFFHGLGGTPESYGNLLAPAAETAGIVLILPKSVALGWGDQDVAVANEALTTVEGQLSVDARRIGLSGHSAGGAFAYLLAYGDTTVNAVFAISAPYYTVSSVADSYRAPIRMCYGSLDPNYTGGSEAALNAQWTSLGIPHEEEVVSGAGHSDVVGSLPAMTRGMQFLAATFHPASGTTTGTASTGSGGVTTGSATGTTTSGTSGGVTSGSATGTTTGTSSGSTTTTGGSTAASGTGSTAGSPDDGRGSSHGSCGIGGGLAALLLAALAGMRGTGGGPRIAGRNLIALVALLSFPFGAAMGVESDSDRIIMKAFADHDYQLAEKTCRDLVSRDPADSAARYNLACALARQGDHAGALGSLEAAIESGFTDSEHIATDDDLAAIRGDQAFTALVERAEARSRQGPYEVGADLPGVTTIDDDPVGGLRYRLRMAADASAERPNRLIIWLHPSGGSMNSVVEAWSPMLTQHGYALLVMTRKNWLGWQEGEVRKLLGATLSAVTKIPGIDAAKPILMGFSAGGQVALDRWSADPGAFGGIVVDAAYPLDMQQYQQGRIATRDLPTADAVKRVPLFVLVGGDDGLATVWRGCAERWTAAGVPLSIEYVPAKGHAWLFGEAQVGRLTHWLDDLRARRQAGD